MLFDIFLIGKAENSVKIVSSYFDTTLLSPQIVVPAQWPSRMVWRGRLGGISMADFGNRSLT